jgi:hypothetical protein
MVGTPPDAFASGRFAHPTVLVACEREKPEFLRSAFRQHFLKNVIT